MSSIMGHLGYSVCVGAVGAYVSSHSSCIVPLHRLSALGGAATLNSVAREVRSMSSIMGHLGLLYSGVLCSGNMSALTFMAAT
jgi:hypothetical protein